MIRVTALDFEQWSDRIESASELPRLLSHLIWASSSKIKTLEMPGGELIRLSGFDGLVECEDGTDLIPSGKSAWELSVEARPLKKANREYDKRTKDSKEVRKAETTFVFATARKWPGGKRWADFQRAKKEWLDVRVIWSQDLEKWISRYAWLERDFAATKLFWPTEGIKTLGMIRDDYSAVALKGSLGADFVLAGRGLLKQSFIKWMTDPRGEQIIRIVGPSQLEIIHYLSAAAGSLSHSDVERIDSRVFFVSDAGAARQLGRLDRHHVVLTTPGEVLPQVLLASRRTGCRVAIVHADGVVNPIPPPAGCSSLTLEAMPPEHLIQALMKLGRTESQAAEDCSRCGCDYERIRRDVLLC